MYNRKREDLDLEDLNDKIDIVKDIQNTRGKRSSENLWRYRALDALIGFKDRIEMRLFTALKPDTSLVHYDLIKPIRMQIRSALQELVKP